MDIINQFSVYNKVDHIRPDVIIHCAAYTKVDLAESDSDRAYQVNAIGTRNVAVAAEKNRGQNCLYQYGLRVWRHF